MRLHHAAICTSDIDASLAFWRDGLGLAVLMDHRFDGDWPTLFGSTSSTLRSIFLGDPSAADAGIVELVDFDEAMAGVPPASGPRGGFFLLSFNVDLTSTLARLHDLGVGGDPSDRKEITVHGVRMAVVTSPDGVRVELLDLADVALDAINAADRHPDATA